MATKLENSTDRNASIKYLSDYMKDAQSDLFQRCGVFWAFDQDQFDEWCKTVWADSNDKLVSIGDGWYCLKKNIDALKIGLEQIRQNAIKEDLAENGIERIIWRELANHEAQVSFDLSDVVMQLEHYWITSDQIQAEFVKYLDHCEK